MVVAVTPALSFRVTVAEAIGAPVAAVPLRTFPPEGAPLPPPLFPHPASSPTMDRPKNVAEANPRSEHRSAGVATDDECSRMGTIGTLLPSCSGVQAEGDT